MVLAHKATNIESQSAMAATQHGMHAMLRGRIEFGLVDRSALIAAQMWRWL